MEGYSDSPWFQVLYLRGPTRAHSSETKVHTSILQNKFSFHFLVSE
jgi:hypothetical protein